MTDQHLTDEEIAEATQRIRRHQHARRYEEAAKIIETSLARAPNNLTLRLTQAVNAVKTGATAQGRAMFDQLLSEVPDNPLIATDYGAHLAESGDLDGAIDLFEATTVSAPNFAPAHGNLGAALVLKREIPKAIPHLQKAISLDHSLFDAHQNLAAALIEQSRFDEAIEVLFKALALNPRAVGVHIHLAHALFRRERHEAAEHHARRALELAPDAKEAWYFLGSILGSKGQIDEAARALQKAIDISTVGQAALGRLIHLRKTETNSPEFQSLQLALEQVDSLRDEQRASLHFAAGKSFEDLEQLEKAVEHFISANDVHKRLFPFDAGLNAERAKRLRAFSSAEMMERVKDGGFNGCAPIFICGMPRSGTTLLDQMLSGHPLITAAGEMRAAAMALSENRRIREALEEMRPDTDVAADDFTRLGEAYDAHVRAEGHRAEIVTNKLPANYNYIGLLAPALPRAKFLILRRHPMDCLWSCYMQHFGENQPFSSDFASLASVYSDFDMLARYWPELLPNQVHIIHYENLVKDAESTLREALAFIGLDWDENVLDHTRSSQPVNTASVGQVRQPLYSNSAGRWRRYGPLLKDLAASLGDHLSSEELAICGN